MAQAPKVARGTLPASSGTLWTVTSGATAILTSVLICNTTTTDRTFTLAFDGVAVFTDQPIPAKGTLTLDCRQVLAATKLVTGSASAGSAVTYHVSGSEG